MSTEMQINYFSSIFKEAKFRGVTTGPRHRYCRPKKNLSLNLASNTILAIF